MKTLAFSIVMLLTSVASARDSEHFPGRIVRVIDGDTLEVQLYLGLGVYKAETVRLLCVNTPEIHGPKAKDEHVAGEVAAEFTRVWGTNPDVQVYIRHDQDRDVYGRLLAVLYHTDSSILSLNQELLLRGYAKRFMCDDTMPLTH